MFHPKLFERRNVVVTGAGRGIGLEVARQFLDCGAHVLVHIGRGGERDLPDFLLMAEGERRAFLVPADFTSEEGTAAFAATVGEVFDRVDVLVNNAGTMLGRFPAGELTDEQYERVVQLNQTSVVEITRALLPMLKASGEAAIVNTVSISALTGGSPGSAIYSASKAFVATYSKALARELAPDGITRELRVAGHDRHRFSRTLLVEGQAGADTQEHTAAAARHSGRLRSDLSLPRRGVAFRLHHRTGDRSQRRTVDLLTVR